MVVWEIMGGNCDSAAIIKRDPEGGYFIELASIVTVLKVLSIKVPKDWKLKFAAFFGIADKDFGFSYPDYTILPYRIQVSFHDLQILSKRIHLPCIIKQLYPLKLRIADDRVVGITQTKVCLEINILFRNILFRILFPNTQQLCK